MDVFLLAAVGKLRLLTLYQLKRGAALEPGSIRVSISRLARRGLVVRPNANGRDPRPMQLTDLGKQHLCDDWRVVLDPDKELESVLRAATVAMVMASASAASTFLQDAAASREHLSGHGNVNATRLQEGAVAFHAEARAVYERRKRVFEAKFLRELATNLIDGGAGERSFAQVTREVQP